MKHFIIILFLAFFIIGGCGGENNDNFEIESPVDLIETDQPVSTSADSPLTEQPDTSGSGSTPIVSGSGTGNGPPLEEITISNITGIAIDEAIVILANIFNADECFVTFIEIIGSDMTFPTEISGEIIDDLFISEGIITDTSLPYSVSGIIDCMNEVDSNSAEFFDLFIE